MLRTPRFSLTTTSAPARQAHRHPPAVTLRHRGKSAKVELLDERWKSCRGRSRPQPRQCLSGAWGAVVVVMGHPIGAPAVRGPQGRPGEQRERAAGPRERGTRHVPSPAQHPRGVIASEGSRPGPPGTGAAAPPGQCPTLLLHREVSSSSHAIPAPPVQPVTGLPMLTVPVDVEVCLVYRTRLGVPGLTHDTVRWTVSTHVVMADPPATAVRARRQAANAVTVANLFPSGIPYATWHEARAFGTDPGVVVLTARLAQPVEAFRALDGAPGTPLDDLAWDAMDRPACRAAAASARVRRLR